MSSRSLIAARVTPELKARVEAAAHREFLTESVWLRRIVHVALETTAESSAEIATSDAAEARDARLSVRLAPEDRRLLHERASARGMPAATYVSVLVRSHLRHLTPLPKQELLSLRAAVSELGGIGRNLNQVARAANHGARLLGIQREELGAFLKVCEVLRDHVKSLIKANTSSWSTGHAQKQP